MRHPRLFFAVAVLAITAGCGSGDNPLGSTQPLPPLRREVLFDCGASPEQCATIDRAITAMEEHANPTCRLYAQTARERFDAASGEGYRNASQVPGDDMGVTVSWHGGSFTTDGYTDVYPSFWNKQLSDTDAGALILHEELHHELFGETIAYQIQHECENPQP